MIAYPSKCAILWSKFSVADLALLSTLHIRTTAQTELAVPSSSKGKQPEAVFERKPSVVPSQHLDDLSQGIKQLETDLDRDHVERTLQWLDQTLRKCWSDLGLDVHHLPEVVAYQGEFKFSLSM